MDSPNTTQVDISSEEETQTVIHSFTNPALDDPVSETYHTPKLSLLSIFLLFLSFGVRAFGGPVASISLIKQQLVIEQKWISIAQFHRVLSVYQVLPGPEATELSCYFGYLSRGRLGALAGGLGFMSPGFVLMLLFAWIYNDYGLSNQYVRASFKALQPTVAAFVLRAVLKIGNDALKDGKNQFSLILLLLAFMSALQTVMRINFLITLAHCGFIYVAYNFNEVAHKVRVMIVIGLVVAWLVTYGCYVAFVGLPPNISVGIDFGSDQSLSGLFLLGLMAGLLTFGGAYTSIPFIQRAVVEVGKWMTNQQFLDGLAIGAILPAPLTIFSTFVGYAGAGVPGAVLMTIGMYLPAFSFTLIGHNLFERISHIKQISTFLEGVTASVVGLISITALQLLKSTVLDSFSVVLYLLSLMAVSYKLTSLFIVFSAVIAGQVLYV